MHPLLLALDHAFFPPRCAGCHAIGDSPFCAICAQGLYPIDSPLCTRCGAPFAGGVDQPCGACVREPPPYSTARASFRYGGAVRDALVRLKFSGRREIARALGPLLPPAPAPARDLVVPVPLGRRRLAEREFNQALLLARAARLAPIDSTALLRVRDTPPQTSLSAAERRANLRGAFAADTARVAGRRVLLVDDVVTTGATIEACARALRAAGAADVAAVSLARVA